MLIKTTTWQILFFNNTNININEGKLIRHATIIEMMNIIRISCNRWMVFTGYEYTKTVESVEY